MLAIFAVIIGGIATGRLLIGRRLAFVPRLITVIIWALLFLLGVEVGSDPAVVGSLATLGGAALAIFALSSSPRGCCGGGFADAPCLPTTGRPPQMSRSPHGRPFAAVS